MTVTAPRPSEPRIAVLEEAGLRWIQIESPGAAEVAWLDTEFPFHELDLEDVRSRRQRPKVDDYDDYLFVVLHFPWYDAGTQRLYAAELNAFIGRDYLITLPNVPLKPISALFRRYEKDDEERQEHFAKGAGYVFYEVLDAMYAYCFPILDSIGRKLDDIEDALFDEGQSVVQEISNAKQEIISYRKIMKPQRPALRLLERDTTRFLAGDLEIYYDDLVDASERIWDVLDNYKEVAEALERTNESIIDQRQSRILRILTVLTVLFLPLTFVTGLFGMNTGVPWEGQMHGFWVVHDRHRRARRQHDRRVQARALAVAPIYRASRSMLLVGPGDDDDVALLDALVGVGDHVDVVARLHAQHDHAVAPAHVRLGQRAAGDLERAADLGHGVARVELHVVDQVRAGQRVAEPDAHLVLREDHAVRADLLEDPRVRQRHGLRDDVACSRARRGSRSSGSRPRCRRRSRRRRRRTRRPRSA